jgi:hypothetical protein
MMIRFRSAIEEIEHFHSRNDHFIGTYGGGRIFRLTLSACGDNEEIRRLLRSVSKSLSAEAHLQKSVIYTKDRLSL